MWSAIASLLRTAHPAPDWRGGRRGADRQSRPRRPAPDRAATQWRTRASARVAACHGETRGQRAPATPCAAGGKASALEEAMTAWWNRCDRNRRAARRMQEASRQLSIRRRQPPPRGEGERRRLRVRRRSARHGRRDRGDTPVAPLAGEPERAIGCRRSGRHNRRRSRVGGGCLRCPHYRKGHACYRTSRARHRAGGHSNRGAHSRTPQNRHDLGDDAVGLLPAAAT